ncbi:hypothetical protein [Sporosarcina sp.]|uniref:hypothetical protein n=1 Tax=Sporosarcina sp. TaxID=49982 RepID=UPI002604B62E|nr:hypothetical protein [Sporosarcina sp.]
MEKNVREIFHKGTQNEELGLEFEASAAESARRREGASGKEYRNALKELYRSTEKKRS